MNNINIELLMKANAYNIHLANFVLNDVLKIILK